MIWFFGTRNCGKVDHVPGLFFVVSSFFHVQFIPLVPTGSVIMLDDGSDRGMKTSMSGKSVLFAYLRAFLLVGGVIAMILGVVLIANRNLVPALVLIPFGIVMVIFFFLTYKLSRPSPERALFLAGELGLPPELIAEFFVTRNIPLPPELERAYQDGQAEVEPIDKYEEYDDDYRRKDRYHD